MPSTSSPRKIPETVASANDLATLAALREALGDDVLKDLLNAGFAKVDKRCEELQAASRRGDWAKAADIAFDVADTIANLGFRTITGAARSFAAATNENVGPHVLRNGAQTVVFEFERLRLGIQLQFPELLA